MDLPVIWSILIGLALFIYMALDGFDLGIGILFPLSADTHERDHMMDTIAPIWDTNETWIILAAGGLYGVFPKAYVFIFNALYIPLITMLIFLIFRGVSFEFRFKSDYKYKFIWSFMFFIGSLGASLCQGIILGQLICGFHTANGHFDNDYWGWYHGFNFMVSGFIVIFYSFMGSNFLIYRLKDIEKEHFIILSKRLLWITILYGAVIVLILAYLLNLAADFSFPTAPHLKERFLRFYGFYIALFILISLVTIKLYRSLRSMMSFDGLPFVYGVILLFCVFFGVSFLGWPYIVPGVYTIWEASSLPETQKMMLIAAITFLPLILGYSMYNFYIFRGKVADQKFYH